MFYMKYLFFAFRLLIILGIIALIFRIFTVDKLTKLDYSLMLIYNIILIIILAKGYIENWKDRKIKRSR